MNATKEYINSYVNQTFSTEQGKTIAKFLLNLSENDTEFLQNALNMNNVWDDITNDELLITISENLDSYIEKYKLYKKIREYISNTLSIVYGNNLTKEEINKRALESSLEFMRDLPFYLLGT